MSDLDLDELRAELDDFAEPEKKGGRSAARGAHHRRLRGDPAVSSRSTAAPRSTARTATSSSGFMPCASTACARLRSAARCLRRSTIKGCWPARRLSPPRRSETMDDDELLAELEGAAGAADITELRHVRTSADKRAAEEIANRTDVRGLRDASSRCSSRCRGNSKPASARPGRFETRRPKSGRASSSSSAARWPMSPRWARCSRTRKGERDAACASSIDNGTESNLLHALASARAPQGRGGPAHHRSRSPGRCSPARAEDDDLASGTIYVLRSKSDHPVVAANRDVLHKIGVTGGDVDTRIANAKLDPTFLMADVEIVATYELYNINRTKLENLIHRIFDPARLDIEIKDRFGNPVVPREWFLVPLFVIDEAVERIKDGTITGYVYNPKTARLEPIG